MVFLEYLLYECSNFNEIMEGFLYSEKLKRKTFNAFTHLVYNTLKEIDWNYKLDIFTKNYAQAYKKLFNIDIPCDN